MPDRVLNLSVGKVNLEPEIYTKNNTKNSLLPYIFIQNEMQVTVFRQLFCTVKAESGGTINFSWNLPQSKIDHSTFDSSNELSLLSFN